MSMRSRQEITERKLINPPLFLFFFHLNLTHDPTTYTLQSPSQLYSQHLPTLLVQKSAPNSAHFDHHLTLSPQSIPNDTTLPRHAPTTPPWRPSSANHLPCNTTPPTTNMSIQTPPFPTLNTHKHHFIKAISTKPIKTLPTTLNNILQQTQLTKADLTCEMESSSHSKIHTHAAPNLQ